MFLIRIPENVRFRGTIKGITGRFERTPTGITRLPESHTLGMPYQFMRYSEILGHEVVDYERE